MDSRTAPDCNCRFSRYIRMYTIVVREYVSVYRVNYPPIQSTTNTIVIFIHCIRTSLSLWTMKNLEFYHLCSCYFLRIYSNRNKVKMMYIFVIHIVIIERVHIWCIFSVYLYQFMGSLIQSVKYL